MLKPLTAEQLSQQLAYSIFHNDHLYFKCIKQFIEEQKITPIDYSWFLQPDGSLSKRLFKDTSSYMGKSLLYSAIENHNLWMAHYLSHQLSELEDDEEHGLGYYWPNYGHRCDDLGYHL